MSGDVEAVAFDLGGVLARFDGVRALAELLGEPDVEAVSRRWLASPWVRSFESGRCDATDFAAGLVGDWGLTLTPATLLDSFRGWLGGALPGAVELVGEVGRRCPVALVSNTNGLHWADLRGRWDLAGCFAVEVLSFQVGLVKPDRAIFELLLTRLDLPPDRVLFLDDAQPNVVGAIAVGLQAARVLGPGEARAELARRGLATAAA